jgi:hypothetical protein
LRDNVTHIHEYGVRQASACRADTTSMGRLLRPKSIYDRRHLYRWQAGATARKHTRQQEMKL